MGGQKPVFFAEKTRYGPQKRSKTRFIWFLMRQC